MEVNKGAIILQRMNALINAGLIYGRDAFDLERYHELKCLLGELTSIQSDLEPKEVGDFLRPTAWYPTPLIDVRAVVIKENKILLVQSKLDGQWALPGGYAEVGTSPNENVLKELKEEAGLNGEVLRLLAIFDSNHYQLQSQQYYKLFFSCAVIDGQFSVNDETAAANFFSIDELPSLSFVRNTSEQIKRCYQVWQTDSATIID